MTLELSGIAAQVSAMGKDAAQRAAQRSSFVPIVLNLLAQHAADTELREKVERAIQAGWGGAIPASEPLDAAFDPPALPDRVTSSPRRMDRKSIPIATAWHCTT